ncbi:hypothetical protein IAQ67_15745 [Paenibacillus peoriae]|uniref:Uncharacterized protein n=1 Tax=Paenibacillus peoriae TaxID=59893 RepID=A0A7H0Y2P0_9BACL|nr:hypothetical protein [Paenibacillus peoriae]QNR65348.1 hypothetical protein IAQ67_15745 [Paenibacillus peoriae]
MEIAARARLRPVKDKDLIEAWNSIPPHKDKADVVREALRLLFFGKTNPPYVSSEHLWMNEKNANYSLPIHSEEAEEEGTRNLETVEEDHEEKLDELLKSF